LAALKLGHRAGDLGLMHVGAGADGFAGHDAELTQADQDAPLRYSNTVLSVDPGQRLGHQAGQHIEPVGQELAELQQLRLRLLLSLVNLAGLVRLAAGFWIVFEFSRGFGTRVHSLTRPCANAALRGCVGGRYAHAGTMAEVRAARNGGLCRSVSAACSFPSTLYRGQALSRATLYREHSMATNSSVLETPTGMAPVISSRSTLR